MIFLNINKRNLASPCLRHHCFKCCMETEMPLLKKDIDLITSRGCKDFCEERDGYTRLKNVDNLCVFLKGRRCSIYTSRPTGCRLYPAIYDADTKTVILDKECPHCDMFRLTNDLKREVKKTVKRLIDERGTRFQ